MSGTPKGPQQQPCCDNSDSFELKMFFFALFFGFLPIVTCAVVYHRAGPAVIEEMTHYSAKQNMKETFAIGLGAPVTFSSFWDHEHENFRLDHVTSKYACWKAKEAKLGEWIQVAQERPRTWTGLIMQGRGDHDEFVRSIVVAYSNDGQMWNYVDAGKEFKANTDRHSKVKIEFDTPVTARTLRIYPQSW